MTQGRRQAERNESIEGREEVDVLMRVVEIRERMRKE